MRYAMCLVLSLACCLVLAQPEQRLVSGSPTATGVLFELGLAANIVGRDQQSATL